MRYTRRSPDPLGSGRVTLEHRSTTNKKGTNHSESVPFLFQRVASNLFASPKSSRGTALASRMNAPMFEPCTA